MVPNNPMPSTNDNSEPHENANDRYTLMFNKGFGYTQLQYTNAAPQPTPSASKPIVDRLSQPMCWPLVSTYSKDNRPIASKRKPTRSKLAGGPWGSRVGRNIADIQMPSSDI